MRDLPLDAYIIEKLQKRREQAREDQRPRLELPLPEDYPPESRDAEEGEESNRGVVVFDI